METLSPGDAATDALRECARQLAKIALFSGAINLLTLSGSIYMLQVYDRVIPSRNMPTLVAVSAMLLVAYLLQGYLDALRSRMLVRSAAIFDISLQGPVYDALATLPLLGTPAAEVRQPALDIDSIRTFLSGAGPTALLDIPWTPLFAIVLFLFHPLIGLAAVFGVAGIISIAVLTDRRTSAPVARASQWLAHKQAWVDSTQRNADVIRALGMLPALRSRWMHVNVRALREHIVVMDILARMGATGKIVRYGLQSAILGLGAYLAITDRASGGIMIASSIIVGRALAPIEIALSAWRQWVGARQAFVRLQGALKTATPQVPRVVAAPPARSLSVRNLAVVAPGSAVPIVHDVSFDLEAGAGLAIVGPSASGKTTLAKALVGVWPPARGSIALDGRPLAHWHVDLSGRILGYLPQDVSLFQGTIAENIARFDVEASPSAILEAAKLTDSHSMIMQLPHAYNTPIGEAGVCLSAGQRQRIGLARAAYGNPFLIVLDEPNSNLDQEGETALDNAVRALRDRGSIVIVVSHRPRAVRSLDRVMVLAGGRMLAFGTHREVSAILSRATGHKPAPAAAPSAGSERVQNGA
jgi:PrtD family type I secretion system ABC transporter